MARRTLSVTNTPGLGGLYEATDTDQNRLRVMVHEPRSGMPAAASVEYRGDDMLIHRIDLSEQQTRLLHDFLNEHAA
jgi:hypothetical protein